MKPTKFIAALCGVAAFVCSCEKEDSKTNDDFMRFKSILSAFALMVPVCMATIFTSCEKKDVTVAVTGIEVTPAFVELKPGETQELKVSVLPENATDKTYTWSSSDESVATVADDVVTAVADGSAVITAVAADGTHKASVTVKVTTPVTGIEVTPAFVELKPGETQELKVSVLPENATDKTYTWSSSDESVATVADDVVTAVADGSAVITAVAADGTHKASVTVKVTTPVTGIEVTPAFVELKPGETQELKVSVLPENATDKTYTWSSSDESVATVADDVVTAVADGSAVITAVAADGTHKASVTVKVTTPVTPPYDGIVASSAGAVFIGDKYGMGYNDEVHVYLLSGDVKYSDSSLSGKGSALWLDLYLPLTGKAVLPAHHYTAMLGEETKYTFQTGMDLRPYGSVTGSYVYENNEYVMVADGTVDITLDGSTYTVDAVVKSLEGKEYKFRYTGAIEVKTSTGGGNVGGTTVDGGWTTVNVGKLTQARFEYYGGDAYGTKDVSDNWILYLYDDGVSIGNDGFTGAGDIMMIELNCPVGVKDHIEPGTYHVIPPTEFTSASVLTPFTTVPGLENSKGHIYGTWYLSSKYSEDESFSGYYGASEGSVTVDKTDNDVYSISFEIKDTDIQGIVSGSFEGKASIFDVSCSASVSMSSASMKSSLKSARRIAFRK